jgi:hypothetical protein
VCEHDSRIQPSGDHNVIAQTPLAMTWSFGVAIARCARVRGMAPIPPSQLMYDFGGGTGAYSSGLCAALPS